jgi:hypothetical protein
MAMILDLVRVWIELSNPLLLIQISKLHAIIHSTNILFIIQINIILSYISLVFLIGQSNNT